MLERVRQLLLTKTRHPERPGTDPVHVATMVLLIEAAMAEDDRLDGKEFEHLCGVASNRFGLDAEDVSALIEEARTAQRDGNDLWQFTNELNQGLSRDEKRQVMEDLWDVFYLDGRLGGHEDHLAHKVAELLRITHREMIQAKLTALERNKKRS